MYTKHEASAIRQKFWTSFGQYLAPVPSASGEKIHWINYKTGIRSIQVRMDVTTVSAYIAIEVSDKNQERQAELFGHLRSMKNDLGDSSNWKWEDQLNPGSKTVSRAYKQLNGVNIFNEADWPAIITFLKSNLVFIDEFWVSKKDIFEMIA